MKHFYVINSDGTGEHYELINGKLPRNSLRKQKSRNLQADLIRLLCIKQLESNVMTHQHQKESEKSKKSQLEQLDSTLQYPFSPDDEYLFSKHKDDAELDRLILDAKIHSCGIIFDDISSEPSIDEINLYNDKILTEPCQHIPTIEQF